MTRFLGNPLTGELAAGGAGAAAARGGGLLSRVAPFGNAALLGPLLLLYKAGEWGDTPHGGEFASKSDKQLKAEADKLIEKLLKSSKSDDELAADPAYQAYQNTFKYALKDPKRPWAGNKYTVDRAHVQTTLAALRAATGQLEPGDTEAALRNAGMTEEQVAARDALNQQIAQAASGAFGRANSFDPSSVTTRGKGYEAAAAAVVKAQRAVENATDRERTAEERLHRLRSSAKSTADQIAAAERSVAAATRGAASARENLTTAEKKQAKERHGSAETSRELLATLEQRVTAEQTRAHDLVSLARRGLGKDALAYLTQEDAAHPGSLHVFATSATKALLTELNKAEKRIKTAAQFEATALENPQAFRLAAKHNADAYLDKLEQTLATRRARHADQLDVPELQQPAVHQRGSGYGPAAAPLSARDADRAYRAYLDQVAAAARAPVAAAHERGGGLGPVVAQKTTYEIAQLTVVAQNPGQLAAQLAARARVHALAGGDRL